MSVAVTRWTIAAEGEVGEEMSTIEVRMHDGEVIVEWPCGDTRTFTLEGIEHALAHVKDSKGTGAWVELKDRRGDHVYAKRVGDQLYANDAPEGGTSVAWRDLRKAIKQAIKQGAKVA